MKKFYIILIALLFAANFSMNAQIQNGEDAPDFTVTDVNGVEHHLYDYLSQGKTVVLNFFVPWWELCWNYHTSGILDEAWNLYGPNGTDELVIFQIDADPLSGINELQNSPFGNWLKDVDYYTIDDDPEPNPNPAYYETVIANIYQVTYVPMIYIICPSHVIFEDNYLTAFYTADEIMHHAHTYCHQATEDVDVAIYRYFGEKTYCDDVLQEPKVVIYNYSIQGNLNNAVIQTLVDGEVVNSYDYVGDLAVYDCDTVTLDNVTNLSDTPNLTFKVVAEGDTEPKNDELSPIVRRAMSIPNNVIVEVQPDNFYKEFSFVMIDENDNIVYKCDSIESNDLQTIEITLPENTCINWILYDEYGDGMPGGYVRLLNAETDEELLYIVGKNIAAEKEVLMTTVQYVNIVENEMNTSIYPNPAKDFVKIEGDVDNVKIYNVMGQIISVTDENIIDVSKLNNGIYLFNITMRNGKVESRRIVVE